MLLLCLMVIFLAWHSYAEAASPEDKLGRMVLASLKKQRVDGLMDLLLDEATLRAMMEKEGTDAEEIEKQVAKWNDKLPEIKERMAFLIGHVREQLGDDGIAKAKFLRTDMAKESNTQKLNRRDLYVILNVGTKKYVVTLYDSIETPRGWKLTGKVNFHFADQL